jgi:hypothetical protein
MCDWAGRADEPEDNESGSSPEQCVLGLNTY